MLRTIASGLLLLALPAAALAGHEGTTFTIRVENVSTGETLKGMNGMTAPAPNSPGVWVVHTKPGRFFQDGKVQMGWGLEAQAEDGNPMMLAEHCSHHEGVVTSGVFDTPVGDDKPGPALPGKSFVFTVAAKPGDRLSFTTMFGQSNDWFYAPMPGGIALFEKGRPMSGDVTKQLVLWDAGTEMDEEPGFGPNQGPRQSGPNTGPAEKKPVMTVAARKSGYAVPPVTAILKVTVTPAQTAAH